MDKNTHVPSVEELAEQLKHITSARSPQPPKPNPIKDLLYDSVGKYWDKVCLAYVQRCSGINVN